MSERLPVCAENVACLYHKCTEMYRKHKYPPSQLWNEDESGAHACNDGALVLTSRGVRQPNTHHNPR